MHLILCVDSRGGLSFCGKRQSADSILRVDALNTSNGRLFMNAYSAAQFGQDDKIKVDENYLSAAGKGDYCFCETDDFMPFMDKCETVTVYCWNRSYPFTESMPNNYKSSWQLLSSTEFSGSSHEKITKEVYKL